MRYKVVFWPMLTQTLSVVSTLQEGNEMGWETHHSYSLKTEGHDLWPLPHLLRELADMLEAAQF